MMTPIELVVCVPLGALAVYTVARLITAAYFKSKQQHEKETNHVGT